MQKLQYGDSVVFELVLPDTFDPAATDINSAAAVARSREALSNSTLRIHIFRGRLHDADLGEPY